MAALYASPSGCEGYFFVVGGGGRWRGWAGGDFFLSRARGRWRGGVLFFEVEDGGDVLPLACDIATPAGYLFEGVGEGEEDNGGHLIHIPVTAF